MRIRTWSAALVALAIVGSSCSENDVAGLRAPGLNALAAVSVATATLPAVRISEFHYDNTSTDVDEKVEISGPAGTNLVGWQLVLYNGAATSRAPYTTTPLTGKIPATCEDRGVVVIGYPSNGIQNGDPDGIALVRPGGNVVEFLSYGGNFVAASGPAVGMRSTDIGIKETAKAANPVSSLTRDASGKWSENATNVNTFLACNDAGPAPATAEVATITVSPTSASVVTGGSQLFTATAFDSDNQQIVNAVFVWSTSSNVATVNGNGFVTGAHSGDVQVVATTPNGVTGTASLHVVAPAPLPPTRFSEIHYDNVGDDKDEAIEIEGPAGTDLTNWRIVLYNGNGGAVYSDLALSGVISGTCSGRGVAVTTYPFNGIQNGPDAMALVNGGGTVVEFLSYEGVVLATDGPAAGMTSTDIGISENSSPVRQSLQRDGNGLWQAPPTSSFGTCNPPPVQGGGKFITFSGRSISDPALPVGFEAQIFATQHDGSNVVSTTIAWVSENPEIASVDANGVIHANSAGTATFRATATDGTTGGYSLPTVIATEGGTAEYAGNAEFGEPTDGDPSNDFIIRRPQYITSFNRNRNTPNWVSYDLDASQFGNQDRCNCFTHDPLLPGDFTHLTTADYTGAGTAAGYAIDRGHLARSFDRTTGTLDNARTFYLSNIIPQAADLNQGPWADMENDLGDLARFQNKEVYIIAGIAGSKGTVKGEDKITIPAQVWKVALILPRDAGLASVHDYRDVEAIAVIMPNDAGVRNVNWHSYETTVDAVEAASGYDLLALLPDKIERAIASNTKPPVAVPNGPYTSMEGSPLSLSGSESFDAGGTITGYSWTFGDGGTASGSTASHTYAQDGTYMVRLIVTDNHGVADTSFTSASVANVVPSVSTFAGATLLPGETYGASGSFADPGADPWSATVNYGDGAGAETLVLNGKTFALSHTYMAAGTFTVTVRVSDDDAGSSRSQFVTVISQSDALTQAARMVEDLASAASLNAGNANSLNAKIDAALKQLENGNSVPAANQLRALLRELDAMVGSGRVTEQDAQPLRTMVRRVISSISL